MELCFTTDLSKQNTAFLMCSGNRLSQISLASKDSGVKEMFYHCMLLNPKVLSDFISSPLLVFSPGAFPDTTPLVRSKHRASSGTPLPCFLTSLSYLPFPYLCPMKFSEPCLLHLCVLVLPIIFRISNNPLAISTVIFPFISCFMLIILCFTEVHSPPFPALHPLHFWFGLPSGRHQRKFEG